MTSDLITEVLSAASGGGGSGFGISRYVEAGHCGQAARISVATEENTSSEAQLIGTFYHKLQELYHSEKIPPGAVAIPLGDIGLDEPEDRAMREALRLFKFYVYHYSPLEFGKVVAVERQIPGDRVEAERVAAAFPVPGEYLTSRLDMLSYMSGDDVAKWQSRGLDVSEPGYYIEDHKTMKAKSGTLYITQTLKPQFNFYYMMAIAALGLDIKGVISINIVRHRNKKEFPDGLNPPGHKSESLFPLFHEAPTLKEQDRLKAWLPWALTRFHEGAVNLANCDAFGGCYYYKSGACDRETLEWK